MKVFMVGIRPKTINFDDGCVLRSGVVAFAATATDQLSLTARTVPSHFGLRGVADVARSKWDDMQEFMQIALAVRYGDHRSEWRLMEIDLMRK